mgnify:CR=1 FL=1
MNIPFQSFAQWGPHHGPHGPMGPDWVARSGLAPWSRAGAEGFALLLPILSILLLAVLVIGAIYLLGTMSNQREPDHAQKLLRERYARGEITDEEFETRTTRLTDSGDRNAQI